VLRKRSSRIGQRALTDAAAANATPSIQRRGVGMAGMLVWLRQHLAAQSVDDPAGIKADGRLALHQGADDIGQGSNTVIPQLCAEALGAGCDSITLIGRYGFLTPGCGQDLGLAPDLVTGKAAQAAAKPLRPQILRLANAGSDAARLTLDGAVDRCRGWRQRIDRVGRPAPDARAMSWWRRRPIDHRPRRSMPMARAAPYAVYGYGAHLVELAVDTALGTVRLLNITAAHDVGPRRQPDAHAEGQIEGGIAQGIGMALMEEYITRSAARTSMTISSPPSAMCRRSGRS
jgi:aldehyde oxidoreductase